LRFSGNKQIKDRTLETLIRTRTNREFLGINRFTPWYYIWKASGGKFGEKPVYLDRQVVINDMERLTLYYNSLGYRGVKVDTTIITFKKNQVEVSFLIDEGKASHLNTIAYSGIPNFKEANTKINFLRNSPLTKDRINDSTFVVNRQFNMQELRQEQLRIIDYLKNNGYASIQRDSVIALIRPMPEDTTQLDVQFRVNAGKIFHFGEVYLKLADTKLPDNYDRIDTLNGVKFTNDSTKKIYRSLERSTQTNPSLLSDQILFKPGDVYNHDLYLNSVREFQNLGMLFIRRFGQSETSVLPDYQKEYIPTYIDLQTVTKHSFNTELFGMKRYGYGTGLGVDYTNNNVFGKAENFILSANTSFEFVSQSVLENIADTATQSSVFRSYEIRGDYTVPRLNFPFAFLDNTKYFTRGITRYSLSYSRSDQLYFDINSDIQFNLRYEVTHSPRFSSFLDLVELDVVDASPTDEFRQNLNNEFGVEEGDAKPIELLRILEDFEPQVSSVIRYSFRSQRTDMIKRNYGYFSEYSIASGGNIPFLLDKYVITPGTIEGDLPSLFNLSNNSLKYSQYFKITADYRRYYSLSNSSVFAWRLFGGLAHPYGKNPSIPLNRRFFAGGSNDIRGWAPFQLGPGGLSGTNVTVNGGEIKLAAFTEARQIFLRNFLKANWHAAWYVDAGNIWYGPRNEAAREEGRFKTDEFYNQVAVGSGLGLRLDWNYVIVRFDFTFRAHDLDVGWFNNKKLYFSFGIGHSF
tara:strand:+ start:9569 stop:11806 length:2238 start_codon:yes stop_codon:yes gene_type:complete